MMLKRPSLGQAASLGTLYGGRSDTFGPLSLLRKQPPDGAISKTDIPSSNVKYCRFDTYKEKFNHLDIGPQLSASFLVGFLNVDGSGRYLTAEKEQSHRADISALQRHHRQRDARLPGKGN